MIVSYPLLLGEILEKHDTVDGSEIPTNHRLGCKKNTCKFHGISTTYLSQPQLVSFLPRFLNGINGYLGKIWNCPVGSRWWNLQFPCAIHLPQLRLGQIWWVREGLLRAPCGAALSFLFKTRVSGTRTHTQAHIISILYICHIYHI